MNKENEFRVYSTVTGSFDYFTIKDLLTKECRKVSEKAFDEDLSIEKFTGLLDCNGTKIFEGDIVEVSYDNEAPSVHVVKWYGNEYPAFELSPELGCDCNGFSHIYNCGDTTITVIGNIHQNSELLK